MLSPTQILLIIVVSVLTAILVVIGFQVVYILRESRRSIEKVNKMLDDAGKVSEAITKPIVSLSNSLGSLSGLTGFFSWLINRRKKNGEEKKDE
ncbi:hypothetical protein MUP50_01035 [Patescibacteria group bacterium]|nr:hypothetical protein [Patescibacteria group bacterium]